MSHVEVVLMNDFKKLFEPAYIGKLELKNRIAMAPMGIVGMATPQGGFSQRAIDYYVERAKGGVGLIITSLCKVENEIERLPPGALPVVTEHPLHFMKTASELTERVHAYGTKIFLQLNVGLGRVANPHLLETHPIAPSPIPNYWDPSITCRELTTEEVETLVRKTIEAAEIAALSGFDGVDIHAVHEGYLLDQFAIALFNRRTDKYGGDLEGRLRFATEIVRGIKKRLGRDFPVSLRYSVKSFIKDWNQGALPGEDFVEKGRDLEEGLEAAKILEKAGYDAFNMDNGSYDAWYWAHPPNYMEYGFNLPFSAKLKEVVSVPVMVAGRINYPDIAEKALEEGKADIVVLGRPLLADPYWPKKAMVGAVEDIRPCVGCHDGCLGRGVELGRGISCAVNPACARERDYEIYPAVKPKRVMIIGGGIAGMEAARVAALRGHHVELYEKNGELGGHLIEASVPDFKKDLRRLLEWYKRQLEKLNVKIYLNTEVTPELIEEKKPDVVILATGSKPIVPKIPGVERENVVTAIDVLLGKKEVGENVVVVGGGLVGCETALWLAKQGKRVTIVEMLKELMSAGAYVSHANKKMLIDLLKFHKVKIMTNTALLEITDEGAVVIDRNSLKKTTIPADTVVLAMGLCPNRELYQTIQDKVAEVYLIGDARKPLNIMNAVWDAYEVSRAI